MGQTSRVAKHFLVMLPIMFRRQVFFCFIVLNSPPFSFVAIYSRDGWNRWQDRVSGSEFVFHIQHYSLAGHFSDLQFQ